MDSWLKAALDYLPKWLGYQMRTTEQPGVVVAVAHKQRLVLEAAFGRADLSTDAALTPRHRFRVASHSKSFTAAGILKLRQQDRLRLDDPAGRFVDGLHPAVADATLMELLSHSSGLIRDGRDAGQWVDRRPFLNAPQLRAALAEPPILDASERYKYSNHAYGLLGLVIETVSGQAYGDWMRQEIVGPAGLDSTDPDAPVSGKAPLASGHSGRLPLGRRVVVPGDNPTRALAPATGFVSTAGDIARFYASLDPAARRSLLSAASRRRMIRKQWRDEHGSAGLHYGLGVMIGRVGEWDTVGHGGGFQSCISRTVMLPGRDLAVAVMTNAIDGLASAWSEGAIRILQAFADHGPPSARTRRWDGRWWSLWSTVDLVAFRDHVKVASPGLTNPFQDAEEIEITGRDVGRIRQAAGFSSHGESVELVRARSGKISAVQLAGLRMVPESRYKAELQRRYEGPKP